MIKYFSLFILFTFLISCEKQSRLVGEWEESKYKMETVVFHEDGTMEIKQKGEQNKSPINFKYKLKESKDDYILIDVSVYDGTTFEKKAVHKVSFEDANSIKIENLDYPNTRSNSYTRKQ